MKIIPRSSLSVPPRQRSSIAPIALRELRDSILARSLLHPPVVRHGFPPDDPLPYVLVAGERRLRAIDSIATDGLVFLHGDTPVMPTEVPVTILSTTQAVEYLEAELEENILREDLHWSDRVRALATIHRLRQDENPKQTVTDTAKELADRGGLSDGNRPIDSLRREVTEAAVIASHLTNPAVAQARTASEAFALISKNEEAKYHAELIRRRTSDASKNDGKPLVSDVQLLQGDLTQILPTLNENQFDLIIADPPYGIGADSAGFRSRSAIGGHQYSDDKDNARNLIQTIIHEGFRISRNRANLFMFLDIDLFLWARDLCAANGWTPFRTPLSWIKSESEGLAPWGSSGPRRAVEWILYVTKGQRGLIHSPIDVLRFSRVSRAERTHGAEKPIDLLRYLIECSTLPSESVLDPCCGTGSTLVAAKSCLRRATGIELSEQSYNLALTRIADAAHAPPIIAGVMTAPEGAL